MVSIGIARLALGLAVVLLAAAPPAARAQQEQPWSYDVWSDFMSPYCPGRTLSDCPSGAAESLRMWILMQEEEGRSREEVEAELVARYGDEVLSAPRAEGLGLVAYVIPVLAFLAGGALVALFLRRQTRRSAEDAVRAAGSAPAAAAPAADDEAELQRLVDEELSR